MELSYEKCKDLQSVLWHAFLHFAYMDNANAQYHTAKVRYSPITFRLAEMIRDLKMDKFFNAGHTDVEIYQTVLNHKGQYEEDKGR